MPRRLLLRLPSPSRRRRSSRSSALSRNRDPGHFRVAKDASDGAMRVTLAGLTNRPADKCRATAIDSYWMGASNRASWTVSRNAYP